MMREEGRARAHLRGAVSPTNRSQLPPPPAPSGTAARVADPGEPRKGSGRGEWRARAQSGTRRGGGSRAEQGARERQPIAGGPLPWLGAETRSHAQRRAAAARGHGRPKLWGNPFKLKRQTGRRIVAYVAGGGVLNSALSCACARCRAARGAGKEHYLKRGAYSIRCLPRRRHIDGMSIQELRRVTAFANPLVSPREHLGVTRLTEASPITDRYDSTTSDQSQSDLRSDSSLTLKHEVSSSSCFREQCGR